MLIEDSMVPLGNSNTSFQASAWIIRVFNDRIETEEILHIYEALCRLVIKDKFEDLLPSFLEFQGLMTYQRDPYHVLKSV